MKLKKFDSITAPSLRGNRVPGLTLPQKGASHINPLLVDLMKLKPEQRVALFQDESDPDNWYIGKDGKEGFPVRQINQETTACSFNASGAVQKIFEHFCFEEAAARCVVGKEPVKEDGIVLFPIMFSSAQNYEKPKRKYTRHKTEETED